MPLSPDIPRWPPRQRKSRKSVVEQLWDTAQQQVDEIQQRLASADLPPLERERDTRLLAVMAKTLRELTALDQTQSADTGKKDAPRDDDDAIPRDLDELRRELARRVDLIRRRGSDAGADGGAAR